LRNDHGLLPADLDSVEARVHPLVLELTGKKTPQVGLEAKFSVYHSAAVALIHGAAGEAEYSDDAVRDAQVIAIRDRVTATLDPAMREDQTRVTVRLKDGRVLEKFIEHAIGSLERPMSDADLEAKFRGLVNGVLSTPEADRLIGLCWDIGKLADAGEVARASVPR
jgi:2-methylcitrate dehydratase PrpD